jgi:hypothetical protein
MKLARLIRHRGPDGGGVHIYEAAKKEVRVLRRMAHTGLI